MSNRRYTKQEDRIICKEIEKHPENLSKAFAIAARKTGRVKSAVSQHWYGTLKAKSNIYLLSSSKKTVVNSKFRGTAEDDEKYTALQLFVKKLFKL